MRAFCATLESLVPIWCVRCGWCGPGGNYFWSQWLSRDQKQLYIVLSSVSAFVHHNSPGEGMEAFQYMDSAFTCHKGNRCQIWNNFKMLSLPSRVEHDYSKLALQLDKHCWITYAKIWNGRYLSLECQFFYIQCQIFNVGILKLAKCVFQARLHDAAKSLWNSCFISNRLAVLDYC